jgi:transcriptional regulator with XRE-family HTH domain
VQRPKQTTSLTAELRKAIAESGMSLNQLGKASGVSQAQLSRFVRGSRTLTLPVADRLCGLLGLALTRTGRRAGAVTESEEGGES